MKFQIVDLSSPDDVEQELREARAALRHAEDWQQRASEAEKKADALQQEVWSLGQSNEALQARIVQLEAENRSLLRERNGYRDEAEHQRQVAIFWHKRAKVAEGREDRAPHVVYSHLADSQLEYVYTGENDCA